jgi:short-subunit dehydrogenase
MKKNIVIVGMGPGLSQAVARRFGREGYQVGMIARSLDKLQELKHALEADGVVAYGSVADASDSHALVKALDVLKASLGSIDALHYNAVDMRMVHILEDDPEALVNGFRTSVVNALVAVKHLRSELAASKGSVLITGGGSANFPQPEMGTISLGKAGVRNLAFQLNKALKSDGIYVGTLTVSGWIHPDSTTHSPDLLAGKFWQLFTEKSVVEIVH